MDMVAYGWSLGFSPQTIAHADMKDMVEDARSAASTVFCSSIYLHASKLPHLTLRGLFRDGFRSTSCIWQGSFNVFPLDPLSVFVPLNVNTLRSPTGWSCTQETAKINLHPTRQVPVHSIRRSIDEFVGVSG